LASGTEYAIMIKSPAKTPAEPTPAKARPRINTIDVGAAPHTAEPTSKRAKADRKTHLMEKWV